MTPLMGVALLADQKFPLNISWSDWETAEIDISLKFSALAQMDFTPEVKDDDITPHLQ